MAAATNVMHLVTPGDRVVAVNDVYGGTYRLFTKVYEQRGVRFEFLDAETCNTDLAATWTSDTRLVWIETPTNPLLNIVDIQAAADAAHAAGALLVVDNTFASLVPAAAGRARRRHRAALDDQVPGRPLRSGRRVRGVERRRGSPSSCGSCRTRLARSPARSTPGSCCAG